MSNVVRWIFSDPSTSTSYTVPINPNDGGSPGRKKNVAYQATTAPDGITLIYEGQDEPLTMSFSGSILTQAHYEAFETWFDKRHQVQLTDDLGRTYWIYITSFQPKRKRSALFPWRHDFTIEATILDNP